jgi:cytochrome P450
MLVQAGSDTTAIFLQNLILLLTAYPDVMRRAQEEIDTVVGPERMPRIDDYERLPYLRAVICEARTMFY